MARKRVPKRVKKVSDKHPDKNLKLHLFEKSGLVSANVTKAGPAKTLKSSKRAAARVAKSMTKSKGMSINVD